MIHRFFLSMIHPAMTLPLLLLIAFLFLIAFGNAFGIYEAVLDQNVFNGIKSAFAVLLYAIPAYGLFTVKRWAYRFEFWFSLLLSILGVVLIVYGDFSGFIITIIHGTIALYLKSATCRRIYEK